jgi:type II secretion system protein C
MNDRQIARLFWAARVLLVAVLLYAAIAAILTPSAPAPGLGPRAVSGDERASEQTDALPQSRQNTDYAVLVDSNIFGAMSPSDQSETSSTQAAADSVPSAEPLGLRLVGVIAGGPTTSRAVIEDTNTRIATPYKIGDIVASTRIEAIESDRIVLSHKGRTKVLSLHTARAPRDASPSATQVAAPPSRPQAQPSFTPSARLSYVEDLFRTAKIEPYVKDGRPEGLKISGLEQNPLAAAVGLRNGDIIQTVNGQSLNNTQKAFQVLQKARTQPRISIQLLRDGKARDLSFDL